jgi:hypothetical protein
MNRLRKIAPAIVLASVFACMLIAASTDIASSQQPQKTAVKAAKSPPLGSLCSSKGDPRPGTIHQDACGRLYCMIDVKNDPLKYAPQTAAKLGCEWKLKGNKCQCEFPPAPKATKKSK